ncbi:MAG: DUF262 domain-containing protein [bacterium]|nr:DUF262 domain-containing protein [bacterium]
MSKQESDSIQIKPEIVFIFELLKDIREGKIRVPRFQRPYVWRRDQMLDLLDSIRKHYPIGSLLVWDTESKYTSTSRIGPVKIPPPSGNASYVLDGHQRLSTLAGAFLHDGRDNIEGDDDPGRWPIWYNLDEEYFEHLRPKTNQAWHFPLRKLLGTFDFLEECERLKKDGGAKAQQYVERIKQLLEGFQSYKLPVVRILSTDLGQAVEIFARLNSKGQRISTDQIVSALAYGEGDAGITSFNLATKIDEIRQEIHELGFGGLEREFILRTVLAVIGEDIYQKDWTRIFTGKTRAGEDRSRLKSRLPDSIDPTREALVRSIDFLRGQGIDTDKLLPYSMQIVLLAVFFNYCPEPTEAQRELLQRWLWVSSFTGWFGSANPSRVSWLINEFGEAAKNPDITELKQIDLKAPALPFPSNFDWRSSRVRCTVLAMLERQPRDTSGGIMDKPWELIVKDKIHAVSRILTYPPPETEEEKTLRSSPANRIVNVAGQRGQAKKWLFDLNPAILDKVLESHGIPPEAFEALRQENYQEFLEKRLEHLEGIERSFMRKRGVTPPTDSKIEPPAIDTGDD